MHRTLLIIIGFISVFWAAPVLAFDHHHKLWQSDLGTYVENGHVHYGAWKRSSTNLDQYLKQLKSVGIHEITSWTQLQRTAFWINTYNALVVATIIDHYPFKLGSRVVSIRGMYDDKRWTIAGQQVSLDSIRDHILRETETSLLFLSDIAGRDTQIGRRVDLRILLTICDGTITSAPLRSQAYLANKLDKQLEEQARDIINNNGYVEVFAGRKTIVAGFLFKSFKKDFRQYRAYPALFEKSSSNDRGLLRFLFHYLPRDLQDGMLSRQKSPWRFDFQSGNRVLNGGE